MRFLQFTFLLIYTIFLPVLVVDCTMQQARLNNEKLLIKKLTENYPQKFGRPLLNDSDGPVVIKLRIQLIQIVKLDAIDQTMVTNVWTNYHWTDPYLTWNPDDYNGLSSIRIPASFAFEHDIVLLNNADERLNNQRDALLVIYSNGELLRIPRSLYSSTCNIDLKNFPFDTQNCSISFGSWAYDHTLIDLEFYDNQDKIDLNDYESSKEWQISEKENFGERTVRIIEGKNYTVLTYYLILNRNPGFYTYLLIFPCILLAFLTMVVFWLPPETPSKLLLGMNVFSGFFLLLLLLAELVPTSTNEVPYIGIYYCLNMVMIALSSFLCTIVVHIYFRADTFCKMPIILKKIFLEWLARLYCMQPSKSSQTFSQRSLLTSGLLQGSKNVTNADKFEKFELLKERFKTYRENVLKAGFDNLVKSNPTLNGSFNAGHCNQSTSSLNLNKQNCFCTFCTYCSQQQAILAEIAYLNNLEHDIKEIRDYLRDTRKKLETKELKQKVASDWKQVALVLDRTFFYIYLVITLLTIFLLFPKNAFSRSDANTDSPSSTTLLSTISNAVSTVTSATLALNRNNEQTSTDGVIFF
ncbi:unnamed protein product [Brachionus calyciflorus]|uniref:Uncharacterized protein n=1 Tax=Brachionus calyciflorus TaxID=104777 RepID=A0A813XIB2_9BILA|nr:unnamed protein product [Brachionus calyciflorus]